VPWQHIDRLAFRRHFLEGKVTHSPFQESRVVSRKFQKIPENAPATQSLEPSEAISWNALLYARIFSKNEKKFKNVRNDQRFCAFISIEASRSGFNASRPPGERDWVQEYLIFVEFGFFFDRRIRLYLARIAHRRT
jgi:hypothetical protein